MLLLFIILFVCEKLNPKHPSIVAHAGKYQPHVQDRKIILNAQICGDFANT